MLSTLGFKSDRWIKNEDGISIYVPKDTNSNEWCINLPNDINFGGKVQDFCYYDVSFSFVLSVLRKRLSEDKVEKMNTYILKQRKSKNNKCYQKKYQNCVAAYKDKRNLTYNELGHIIGVTRQRAEQICKSNIREITIKPFAEYEGISVAEFKKIYCEWQ